MLSRGIYSCPDVNNVGGGVLYRDQLRTPDAYITTHLGVGEGNYKVILYDFIDILWRSM